MNKSVVHRLGIVLAFALAAAGCGERTLVQKKTYPVTGKVTMNGEPVAFAVVHLIPKEGKGADATGYTAADGSFEVRTYSNTEMDGAVPGEYGVEVEPFDMTQFMGPRPKEGEKPTLIPKEKRNPDTVVTITDGDNQVNIEL
jgi:hypothetical protein